MLFSLRFIVVTERLSAATGVSRVPCGRRLLVALSDVVCVLRACPPCADACEDAGGALVAAVFVAAPRVGAGVGEGEDCHFLAEVFADGAFSIVYDAFVFVAKVCPPRLEQRFVCEGDDASADGKRTHVEACVPRYERSAGVGGDVAARVENDVCVAQMSVSDGIK